MSEMPKASPRVGDWRPHPTLLEAAARLIEEKRAYEFTTRALAEQPGVSVGSIYRALGPRDAVLLALLAREGARYSQRVVDVQSAATSAEPRSGDLPWLPAVRVRVRALVAHYRMRPALAVELHLEERRLRSLCPRGVRAVLEATFRALLKAHKLSTDEEELSADYLVEMVMGMALVASRGEGGADLMPLARMLATVNGYLERFGVSQPG